MNLAQISSSIIIIVTIAVLNSEELNNFTISNYIHFPYYVIPVHYCTQLDYTNLIHQHIDKLDNIWKEIHDSKNHDSFFFGGETSITINILQSTHYISLHQLQLTISRVNTTLITKNGIIYALNKYKYTYKTNILGFPLLYTLFPGLYTFKIQFFGHLIENYEDNFFKNVSTENTITLLIAPHIQERNGMRQLFPCWDKPQLKATFNISIRHPRYISVLSNMPTRLHKNYDIYSDSLRTYFHITPPMSTFQIAIVMTEYQSIRINENITLWCEYCSDEQSKFEFAQRIINNITLHLTSEFDGINIPKMDHIAIPYFPQDGTSKWGLIFHTKTNLIYNETLDTVMRKIEIAHLIAPKIAYQWFSNLLNSAWYHYWWLHDAFATMFGEEAVVKSFNNSEILDLFIIQNQYESLHLDSHFNMNPVEITSQMDTNLIFSFPRYMKAIIILRMFQSAITDEVFRNNIHIYISRQTFSSIISYNFWSMKEELDETYYCNLSSNEFLTWIQYKHYPVVIWEQYKHSEVTKILSQSNTTSYRKWLIPIILREISSSNINLKTCLTPHINSVQYPITFPQSDCWIVNIEQAGYYRVKYDSITWSNIAKYLNDTAGDYNSISVINRAKIIDDAFHLMMNRQLDVSVFWNLTQFLSQETNFVVWYPMIKVFEYMSITIPFSKEEIKFTDIMDKFRKLLKKPLKILGYEEHPTENDFTKCLRQEIVKWACILQYDECEQSALRKLQQHFGNPEINPLLPWWKHWTYCNGLSIAYSFTWSHIKDIWLKERNSTLLPFLSCFKYGSDATSSLFLELFKDNERQDITNMRSHINNFHLIIMKHSNTYYILEKILTFLKIIKPKQINILTVLVDIINHVYTHNNLMKVQEYVNDIYENNYINISQFWKIQSKLARRLSEIVTHIGHFRFINIH